MKRVLTVFLLCCFLSLLWFYFTTIEIKDNTVIRVENIKEEEELTVKTDKYMVYHERNYNFSMYEPVEGCYLGSYVLANKYINFSSSEFDMLTDKRHPLSLTYIKAGKHIDENWVFRSIADLKTPYIILKPINMEDSLNISLIESTIRSIDQYNIPYFLVLYPNPTELGISPDSYNTFFRDVSKRIKDISPKCAIVWSIKDDHLNSSQDFYPGNDYVDWIGLNLRIDQINKNYFDSIDNFYSMFEETKPLIISELGICNFSNINHKYYINEAQEIMADIYRSLPNYPRIKGVNYLNVNITDSEIESVYSITEDRALLESYKEYISNDHFLKDITKKSNLVGTEDFTYKQDVLLYNKNLYIEDCDIINQLLVNFDDITKIIYKEKMYYSLKDIDTLAHYSIIIDKELKTINLK